MEKPPHGQERGPWRRGAKSSARLVTILELNQKLYTDKMTVRGLEHATEIPPDRKVVIAVSHATDLDIPSVATALCRHFDIAITNQSVQHEFFSDPGANIATRVAGKENFMPVDYHWISGIKKPLKFNPENFTAMAEKMDEGKTVIIAVHNPSFTGSLERAGYGAAYLAEITGAVILPVRVTVRSAESKEEAGMVGHFLKTMKEHPEIDIDIGVPFEPQPVEGIKDIAAFHDKRKHHEPVTKEDIARFDELKNQLKAISADVLARVAGASEQSESMAQ